MDLQVFVRTFLAVTDDFPHTVIEDFRPAAWYGRQACVTQSREHFSRGYGRALSKVLDFNGGKSLDGQARVGFRDTPEEFLVMRNVPFGMQASYGVNLIDGVCLVGQIGEVFFN